MSDVIRDKLELKIKTKKGDKEGAVFEVKYSFDNHTKSTKTKVKTSTKFRVSVECHSRTLCIPPTLCYLCAYVHTLCSNGVLYGNV